MTEDEIDFKKKLTIYVLLSHYSMNYGDLQDRFFEVYVRCYLNGRDSYMIDELTEFF